MVEEKSAPLHEDEQKELDRQNAEREQREQAGQSRELRLLAPPHTAVAVLESTYASGPRYFAVPPITGSYRHELSSVTAADCSSPLAFPATPTSTSLGVASTAQPIYTNL